MEFDFEYISSIISIAKGIPTTLKYTFFAAAFGLVLGFIIFAFLKAQSRFLNGFATAYISIFRGTPLILQLSIIYFGIPQVLKLNFSTFFSIVLAFGMNSAAYIAEIFRSGFNSIPIGQLEACKVLNIDTRSQYKDIILPQIFKNMLPTFINELSSLTKETAIISVIGELDVMRYANLISVEYYTYFAPMLFAGLCYFLIIKSISFIGKKIETKLAYDSN